MGDITNANFVLITTITTVFLALLFTIAVVITVLRQQRHLRYAPALILPESDRSSAWSKVETAELLSPIPERYRRINQENKLAQIILMIEPDDIQIGDPHNVQKLIEFLKEEATQTTPKAS